MAREFGDERQLFIHRCVHSDVSNAPLREAPPDLRARAAALERALPHVNHSVARSGWFAGRRGFVTPSAATVLTAQPLAHDDDEVQAMLRCFEGPIEGPLRPLSAAFAVELFRRHRHAIDLVMPHESVRQYNNLCSLMFALVVDRQQTPFRGLDDFHRMCNPTPS